MRVGMVKEEKYTGIEIKEVRVDNNILYLTDLDNNFIEVEYEEFDEAIMQYNQLIESGYLHISNLKNYRNRINIKERIYNL